MGTSLAEQLRRYAVPQTEVFIRDKKRPSLLFDSKEAAELRRETVYQIGLDGFEELTLKNSIFDQFKNSLFHITSKDFERSIQTKESNRMLNKNIRKFLLLLSPYFLLNCAHKALEWLINRYSVHEYNREDLLMMAMPYHESNIFVRLIQLMKFKDRNDPWYFLKKLQKPGVHLAKQNLLNLTANDQYFIQFSARSILKLVQEHVNPKLLTVAFNFYCTVLIGAIEYSNEVNEDQISQMLPSTLKGLNSNIADFCASSYIIIARLVAKVNLNEEILDKFVLKISEYKMDELKIEGTLVLLVLYQSQKHYQKMPTAAYINLSTKEWLLKVLQDLNSNGSYIYPFLEQLFKANLEVGLQVDEKFHRLYLENVLEVIKFDDSFVKTFLNIFLNTINVIGKYPRELQIWFSKILETIERQYPEQFDKEIYKILSSTKEGIMTKRKKCLQNIMRDAMTLKSKFNVFDKLYHPNPMFRGQAMKFLSTQFESLREGEKEMIKSSLLDRLKDDNIGVVKETLKVIKKTNIVTKESLKGVLINLCTKCFNDSTNWAEISLDVVITLSTISESNDLEVFLSIFPHLLPNCRQDLKKAQKICQTPMISGNILLKPHLNTLQSFSVPEKFRKKIFDSLKNNNFDLVKEFISTLQKVPLENRDVIHKYFALSILCYILPDNSPIEINVLVIDIFITYLTTSEVHLEKSNANIQDHINILRQGKFPLHGFLECLKGVIIKTDKPVLNLNTRDFYENNDINRFFGLLTSNLYKRFPHSTKYLMIFLDYFWNSVKGKVQFLLNLAISNNEYVDENFQIKSLNSVISFLKENAEIRCFVNREDTFVPITLILLLNKQDKVRKKAIKVIDILENALEVDNFYKLLLQGILRQKEEILLDENQVAPVIFDVLSPNSVECREDMKQLTDIRNSLVEFVCDENNPIYIKSGILDLLSGFDTIEIFEQTSQLGYKLVKDKPCSCDLIESSVLMKNLLRFQPEIAYNIKLDTNIWNFVEVCLKNDITEIIYNEKKSCPVVLILNQFDKEFLKYLNENVQEKMLDIIIEIATSSQNPEVLPVVSRLFKHIDLNAQIIVSHFNMMRDVQSPKFDTKKRKRVNVVPTVDILDTLEWKKGVSLLEFIQDKKKIRNTAILIPVLFDILKKCLDFDEQATVEYPKQLILSSILQCCTKLEVIAIPANVFNVELIVQCIRASQNPQTHHHALLVLAYSASIIPTQVLHHVMAIFTFMGSSVLRHDDAYSYQIISKIIDTIIPILIKDNNIKTIGKVLRVFVDALLDVPEHRRIPLYKQLLLRIGIKEHLYIFLLLIFESHVVYNTQEKPRKSATENTNKRIDIATKFCHEFGPDVVIHTCINSIKYLKELPTEKTDDLDIESDCPTFNISRHTPKQFRYYKYTIMTFIANLLASKEFVEHVAVLSSEEVVSMESLYKDIIINILTYIQRLSKVSEKNTATPQAEFWKRILHLGYDILDNINALLTTNMFLLVVKGLMLHNLSTVRRRALELLNSKLQYHMSFFDDCPKSEMYTLVPPLISIIEGIDKNCLESDHELIVQTALLTLKLLVKYLSAEYPNKFVEILDFMTNLIKSGKAHNNILASVVLCLAELCVNLRAHAISSVSNFMPAIVKIFKQQKHQDTPNLLSLSILTTVQKILDTLPLFLSPYLEKLLFELALLSSKWQISADDVKYQCFVNKLTNIQHKIGSAIPTRVLIPTIEHTYMTLIRKDHSEAIPALMNVLGENLSNLKGNEITANLSELTAFFLLTLEFRSNEGISCERANQVETHVIKALTVLILKLSESSFRPLYYKLYDWAVRSEVKSERVITFYSLSCEIAEKLKGLFVLFAGHFLSHSAQVLDACNKIKNEQLYFDDDDERNMLLLEKILRTLLTIFTYDTQSFINRERFDVLMQPIIDQLENTLGDIESLEKRNNQLVVPCIVQFAVAIGDDALWKQMNYQILLKMRHSSSYCRLISLHCLIEIVRKLGEEFLPLLPECIPFLAELLEDEDEKVEKACREAIQVMEKVLGENIQKYF